MYIKILLLVACSLAVLQELAAQPNYYQSRARQTAEYKSLSSATTRAFATSGTSYAPTKSPSSTTTSTASTGSSSANKVTITNNNNGYSNIGADDRVRRQKAASDRMEARGKEQEAIISNGEAQYRKLIAGMGIAKTEEDHYDLLLVGMRQGIDLRAVFNVIGKDLAQYKEKWGNQPDRPFLPSDGRVQEAAHSIRQLNDPNFQGNRSYHYLNIAKAYPTKDNIRLAANSCLIEGSYQKAIYAYENVLKLDPVDTDAIAGMAAAQAFLKYLPQSENSFLRIIEQTVNSDIYINLAWVQMLQGKLKDALDNTIKAAEMDPIHPGFKLIQASLETTTSNAQPLTTKATELLPQLGSGSLVSKFINMAKFLHKENAYQESLIYLDFAVRVEPKNLDLLELRYATNLKVGRDEEALLDERTMNSL